jgi:outer membrane protein TolC
LRARQAVETAEANVALAERLLALARSQREVGAATGLEVNRAGVQLAMERQRRVAAANELRAATLQLLRAMNLPLDTAVTIRGGLRFIPVDEADPAAAIPRAAAARADLKAQLRREAAARLAWSATKAERLPSAAAFADYGATGTALDHARPTRTVGLAVKLPIWDGGRRGARRAESASVLRLEELKTQDLKRQVELELRTAADALNSAAELVKAAEEAERLAEAELAHAERRYRAGAGSSLEVSGAQTRLSRAREDKINATFQHALARLDWRAAEGMIRAFVSEF